jgi:hypothetical protein
MWPHISEMFLTYKLLPILKHKAKVIKPILKHETKVIKNLKYTGGRGSLRICLRSLSLLWSGCNLFTLMDVLGYKVPSKHTSNFLHMLYAIVFKKCILRLRYKAEYDWRAFWKTERPPYNGMKVLWYSMGTHQIPARYHGFRVRLGKKRNGI